MSENAFAKPHRSTRRTRLTLACAAFSLLLGGLPGVASAAGTAQPVDPHEIWPDQVSAAMADLPCDPSGTVADDTAIAGQLNGSLQNKMRGHLNAYNLSCARMIVQAVKARGFNEKAAAIAIATVIVESSIRNVSSGDLDSVGLYQHVRAGAVSRPAPAP